METKKCIYKYYNGTSFDEVMFKTSADMVVFEDGNTLEKKVNSLESSVQARPVMAEGSAPLTLWYGTQQEYDGLAVKDANTLYIVK